jgi:hypothetical protein
MGPKFNAVEKGIVANMVGVVMGVEEEVDSFSCRKLPEGLFLAGGVHQKGLAAFHQKGIAVGVGGMLSEKDFYRADFLSLDHLPLTAKPVPFRWGSQAKSAPPRPSSIGDSSQPYLVIASDPAMAGERGNLIDFKFL